MANLDLARSLASQLVDALAAKSIPVGVPPIASADALDRALSTAVSGQMLRLEPSLVYHGPIRVPQGVTLITAGQLLAGRMTADFPLPRLLGGVALSGDGCSLIGVEVRREGPHDVDVLTYGAAHTSVDRCRILGDPDHGVKRCVNGNGNGSNSLIRCYVDDAFGPYPGSDCQAFFVADCAPGFLCEDNFLRGSSETVMIGGDDPPTADRMPNGITIRGNTITKRAEWMSQPVNVKNLLEVKAGKNILIAHNIGGLSWGGHGQDGYILMLTVRNQNGRAAWSTVEDVDIVNNRWTGGAAAINILGRDNLQPSGRMARVRIRSNTFDALDPKLWVAPGKVSSARMILIDGGPDSVGITDNVFAGINLSSAVYLLGQPQSITDFVFTGNTVPKTPYGLFGGGNVQAQPTNWTDTNAAWARCVASGVLRDNTVAA